MILIRLPDVGFNSCILTGMCQNRRVVHLKPIYEKLGPQNSCGLPGLHAVRLRGCDTTGQIRGLGKKTALTKFMQAPDVTDTQTADLGVGDILYIAHIFRYNVK